MYSLTHTHRHNPTGSVSLENLIKHIEIKVKTHKNTGKPLKSRFGTDSRGTLKNSDVRKYSKSGH